MKTIDIVREILKANPAARDDNARMYLDVIALNGYETTIITYLDVKRLQKAGKLPIEATAERASREIQEKPSELRGKEWNIRKGLEKKVRDHRINQKMK